MIVRHLEAFVHSARSSWELIGCERSEQSWAKGVKVAARDPPCSVESRKERENTD